MRDRPDALTLRCLAEEARREGAEDPTLIARALDIAARETAMGTAPFEALRSWLVERYGEGTSEALLARLAAEIRAGAFDEPGPAQAALRQWLWDLTFRRLALANPDYLAAATG
jgi:hypothetical protein